MANFGETEKSKKTTQTKEDLKGSMVYTSKKEKTEIALDNEIIESMMELNLVKDAMQYISQNKKTSARLITGINCNSDYITAYRDMMIVKKMYNKEGGRMFKHFFHSYSNKEQIDPLLAHEISIKLLEKQKKFKDFQIFAATHIDNNHIHTHYILNTVNLETGKKWQQSNTFLAEMRKLSNQLCKEHGLKHSFVYEKGDRSKNISRGELRAKQENRSWKHELLLTVNECKKISKSREEFIDNMKELNYQVKWQDSRKYITFTTPSGKLCRNNKLENPEDYTKEALEKVFNINQQIEDLSRENNKENIREQSELRKTTIDAKIYKNKDINVNDNVVDDIKLEGLEYPKENNKDLKEQQIEKNRSWKYPLYISIKESLKVSTSREEFIKYMIKEGYQVRWEDTRKDITFTFPDGNRKCNNDKLHPPEQFTKEALERKFKINRSSTMKNEINAENRQQLEKEKSIQATKDMIIATARMLEANPQLGDNDYPLSYLEGQALKEMMIEKAKGEGLDWEKEKER